MHTINQINDPVKKCIAKFDLHPIIIRIIIKIRSHFTPTCIPTRILQGSLHSIAPHITNLFNIVLETNIFPYNLSRVV